MLPGCVWEVLQLNAACRREQCYAEISHPSYLVTNRGAAVVHIRICFVETASLKKSVYVNVMSSLLSLTVD